VAASRQELEEQLRSVATEYEGREIPLPPHWGGYRLRPERFEFWEEQPDRLHDRLSYRLVGGSWVAERLTP
jgi:pyridoxamine 5'-phosphate oxidase